ncbi:plasmid mobilization protein [Parablautia muri]|uniref:Plasmid mobilization relaxosome protein MobC n=1 Tax=Parablautia muri TaxID=2320879 RepID=A0A9X5BIX7_9FIRM|nr:plasmid mobilization relaxosome protein MobC [Parablautia muri]NBJ94935.1 plasmid mobilization relaxosome protein MobC [Parablautia muri]
MAKRERKNELKIFLSNDEQYILEQKVKISGMKSKSAFLRCLILYGFVYDLDYSDLRDYNATLGKISGNLNQIAKRMNATGNVYKVDVEEVKKVMKQVWDTQLAMLKKQPSTKQ